MVYVAADGTVGGKKSLYKSVIDFFVSIWALIALFFTTITNPSAIESHKSHSRNNRTYAQRNKSNVRTNGAGQKLGSKGNNIRGVRDLGTLNCTAGG